MAEKTNINKINIGGKVFDISAWGQFGMTPEYFLALLSRDEFTPVAEKKPTEKDTLYTDPDSGNPAGFHSGQCVIYPDKDVEDGWGLSIAKKVETDAQGIPTKVYWFHATDLEKDVKYLKSQIGYWNDDPLDAETKNDTNNNS